MTQQPTEAGGRRPIRRTTEIEEFSNLHLIHPLAGLLVPFFARLRVTPNAVSVLGMLFGILAAFAYYRYRNLWSAVAGFALMIAWHVMDGADGQLARYTGTFSYFGKVLDGIADNVTFFAVYLALAIALSHEHGNGMYALVAIAAVCHMIQAASYETQRQEYESLGWGKQPQGPAAGDPRKRNQDGHPFVRRLFNALHVLFFVGMSFPTAGLTRKFRATLSAALLRAPVQTDLIRRRYRETMAPQLRVWSVLSANYRTLGIFVSALFKAPEYYFGFEIIGFTLALALLIFRQNAAHDVLRARLSPSASAGPDAAHQVQ